MSSDKTTAVDFPALDVLRLVGALAVLTTHVAFQTGEYFRHGVLGTLLARMDIGVAIFFVLSGFLLSRPWWASAESGTAPPEVGRYALKRVLRIWPVYVVTRVSPSPWCRATRTRASVTGSSAPCSSTRTSTTRCRTA